MAKPRHNPATSTAPAASQGPVRDPLDAVPLLTPGVQSKAANLGHLQLYLEQRQRPGLEGWLNRTLRLRRPIRVNLDPAGSAYWQLIDGERDLHAITHTLGEQLGLEPDAARQAVIAFTRDLMLRGLIHLRLQPPPGTP